MIVDHRNVGAAFRRLSLPIGISMLGDQLLGVADTIAIGTLGAVQLAGATAASSAALVLIFLLAGLWNGVAIIASQRIGADDVSGFARAVRAGGAVALAIALICALLSIPLGGAAMRAMLGNFASVPEASTYFMLRCFALIPIAITGTAITALVAAGHRKFAIAILAIINVVHIPLLLILGLGWLTHHPYGIAGAGLSSLISECAAALASIVYLSRRPVYRIFERLDVDLRLAWQCLKLGAPEMVFLTLVVFPDVVIIRLLAPLGAFAVAGFRALSIVSDLTFVVPSPLQTAAQTVIGQRLGARD
ncbi:MAG: MATE family efflux transporter, partial [Candidatus Eremiobacteraeota bacterium]|nr:MATE family efflux transporter [Candidatus Eremiobacteraeota bacterium]